MDHGTKINRESATPVYVQIANWLASQIVAGNWQPDHQLQSEPELANELGVSRGSLRKAIDLLVKKGMLNQVHGKGTFVRDTVLEQTRASQRLSLAEELNWQENPFATEVLAREICDPSEHRIAEILQLAPDAKVLRLLQRRYIFNEPVAIHETYFPPSVLWGLAIEEFTEETITNDVLGQIYDNIQPSKADHTISAISADQTTSKWLDINMGEPLIYDEHILYDDSENIIEFTKGWLRGDKMNLKTVIYQES